MTSCIAHIHGIPGYEMLYSLLQTDRTDLKLADITSSVLKGLTDSCHCQVSISSIDEESFVCFEESENYVTYRARLNGTLIKNSASFIKEWVSSGPNIHVRRVLMRVDTQCSVVISDFSEEECSGPSSETHDVTTTFITDDGRREDDQSDNTPAIVGGVAAVIIVLIVTVGVTCIAVVALVVWSRQGKLPIKKAEEWVK